MKINNDIGFLYDVVVSEDHKPDPKRMSVTHLIKAPRIRTLLIKRWDDIVCNASDLLNFFDGNNLDRAFVEKFGPQTKLEVPVQDLVLVGKPDLVLTSEPDFRIIYDCKRAKVYVTKYHDTMREWEAQLNLYDWMRVSTIGIRANSLQNIVFYKNWSAESVEKDYPKLGVEFVEQKQWTLAEQEKYVADRMKLHLEQPYLCPDEDRWSSYAVKTKGKVRANRVLSTRKEAEQWMIDNGKGDFIEDRGGRKCKFYCPVRSVCKFSPHCINRFKEAD